MKRLPSPSHRSPARPSYTGLVNGIGELLEVARHATVRVTNTIMTATYWEVGRRVVEFEQGGKKRAKYGGELLQRLAVDLTERCGRGFSRQNLQRFREFYLGHPPEWICSTVSSISPRSLPDALEVELFSAAQVPETAPANICSTVSSKSPARAIDRALRPARAKQAAVSAPKFSPTDLAVAFPLPWSTYVRLLSLKSDEARHFYETEALRGGWSVRQLDRQINSLFYERTALSRNKAALLTQGAKREPGDLLTPDEAVRDPLVLEFLGLRDEYSESDLEDALIRHLETFLLELGGDFAFVGRQRRLRIDDEWYRVDLLFFHRRLRCLVIIDLKLGKLTHADAGQMHLYLNYAREHWCHPEENPPVGLILCSSAGQSLARYALDNLPSKVLAREYRLALPGEKLLLKELEKARSLLKANNNRRRQPTIRD